MACSSRAFETTTRSSSKDRPSRSLRSTAGREIGGSFIRFGTGSMIRGTLYTSTSRCNLTRCGSRITLFQSIAAYCAMNSRLCCNLPVLERYDGSCLPRVASINPSFWHDVHEVPGKSQGCIWSARCGWQGLCILYLLAAIRIECMTAFADGVSRLQQETVQT